MLIRRDKYIRIPRYLSILFYQENKKINCFYVGCCDNAGSTEVEILITGLPDYQPVMITWRDAETNGGPEWVDSDEVIEYVNKPSPIMTTIGFVLYEKPGQDGYLCLSDTYGTEETSAIHKIPNSMILTRARLTHERQ